VATRQLLEAPAPPRGGARHQDLGDDLSRRERGRVDPPEEVVGRDIPASAAAPGADRRAQRDRAGGQLGGGVGQREAAPDGAARPDRRVADVRDRRRDERCMLAHQR
jgi:hypothetical protein